MMKRYYLVLVLICLSFAASYAQSWRYYWYEGELGGGMIVGFTDLDKWKIKPAGSIAVRYKFQKYTSAKLQVAVSQMSGADSVASGLYSYSSLIIAPSLRFEYEIFRSKKDLPGYNSRGLDMDLRTYWVYLFAGFGGVYFDNKPGDDLPARVYKKYTWIAPVGAGIKYNFNRAFSVGAEIGFNFTGSDNLDGYAPDNPARNDKFLLVRGQVAYKFMTTSSSSFRVR